MQTFSENVCFYAKNSISSRVSIMMNLAMLEIMPMLERYLTCILLLREK
jgi:hypothetical protein